MKRPKIKSSLCLVAVLLIGVSMACDEPRGKLVDFEDCDESSGGAAEECIEYEYDGQDTLFVKHVNSSLNCCLERIKADISITDNKIEIHETDVMPFGTAPCPCMCLYTINYEFVSITPGRYEITVNSRDLSLEIDLAAADIGKYCVERSGYPWDEGPVYEPVTCKMHCAYGFKKNENGCEICECQDGKYCDSVDDCACGRDIVSGDCAVGNAAFIDTSEQCPDFCTGIAGGAEMECVKNQCEINYTPSR